MSVMKSVVMTATLLLRKAFRLARILMILGNLESLKIISNCRRTCTINFVKDYMLFEARECLIN